MLQIEQEPHVVLPRCTRTSFFGTICCRIRRSVMGMTDLEVTLDDKYTALHGDVVMSGIQALVRLPLDQHRRDRASGLRTATLVSGYRGSPLGGLDMAFERVPELLEEHHVRFISGVNEDLAAAAVYGSQLANTFPQPRYDGVLGMWYGKGPGVDRTGDAFRHANVAGDGEHAAVAADAGDDPGAKSSTVASASEFALLDAGMPVLYPGNVEDVLRLGLLGFALSRFCGSWVGLKIVTSVADAFSTVRLGATPPIAVAPLEIGGRPWAHTQNPNLLAPASIEQEREMHDERDLAVKHFLAATDTNRIVADPDDAWIGIVSAGKTYRDTLEALDGLGLDLATARSLGIRVLQLGAIHPLEPGIIARFARGLDEIVVVEEKRAFVELFVRDALYGTANAPRIVGKRDEHNVALMPGHGELDADLIRRALRDRLAARISSDRLRPEPPTSQRRLIPLSASDARTPYFCSGCPHSRSTVVPDGSIANGAVGCSTMAMWMDRNTDNIMQMGAEGVHWVGAAPFTEMPHLIQNMGDGTFLHSGSLAVRQAVAAGTSITYKLLYNGAVAMTGGQHHDADLPLGSIVRLLQNEGVARVIVVSDDPDSRRAELPGDVEAWDRDRVIEAQETLRVIPGVTVMVYDQACAADLRRQRKRGLAPTPSYRIMINEAVCEGCGDCGARSNCLSVQPVDTILGRRTQIHQASCNMDETCATGRCPAFVKVTPGVARRSPVDLAALDLDNLPEPRRRVGASVDVLMAGVGGTGVVTINQILGVAARLAGMCSTGLDQTGLAQKGGSVVSHLRLSPDPLEGANLIARGRADVLLAFDPVTAAQDVNLARCDPSRTFTVVNSSVTPTGPQVRDVRAVGPELGTLLERIAASTRSADAVHLDAEAVSDGLFGDHLPANVIMLGAAFQQGLLPLDAGVIEQAIELNGASVSTNRNAFRVGRAMVARREAVEAMLERLHRPASATPRRLPQSMQREIERNVAEPTRRLVEYCTANLIGYQSAEYAQRYLDDVVAASSCEPAGRSELTTVVARELHHLMAYKDEYEVARLHRDQAFADAIQANFGNGSSVQYLLQPPVLERFGLHRKIALGRSAGATFRVLARAKRLRGTKLDVFGRTAHRRMERALADEYRQHIQRALDHLAWAAPDERDAAYERAVALLSLAGQVRGFDEIKEGNVDAWRAAAEEAFAELDAGSTTLSSATPATR
jgi:indolepyruvate ferredoxin oxidoreductase